MTIELNHTIVPAREPKASARFLADILGLPVDPPVARFTRRSRVVYVAGRRLSWMLNPSLPSTATAPVFPPSKSPEARRWPVANS
jgi:hypothetical protein